MSCINLLTSDLKKNTGEYIEFAEFAVLYYSHKSTYLGFCGALNVNIPHTFSQWVGIFGFLSHSKIRPLTCLKKITFSWLFINHLKNTIGFLVPCLSLAHSTNINAWQWSSSSVARSSTSSNFFVSWTCSAQSIKTSLSDGHATFVPSFAVKPKLWLWASDKANPILFFPQIHFTTLSCSKV